MNAIAKPGIYTLPSETYHSNCTPAPALSASFAWELSKDGGCPAKAWFDSPLNPDHVEEHKAHFTIGRAAHLLFLEPDVYDARVEVIDADDYRTKAAREQRDRAYNDGRVPLLVEQAANLNGMRRALRNELAGLPFTTAPGFAADIFTGGEAEQSYFWIDDDFDIWCKCRPDYRRPQHILDYKTSDSADPVTLPRTALNFGWHVRAALYLEGHKALTGEVATYWYVVQEKKPPYLATVAKLDIDFLAWGRDKILPAAKAQFAACLESGRWPSYADSSVIVGMPKWAERTYQDRDDAGEFDPSRYFDLARAWQAPHGQGT